MIFISRRRKKKIECFADLRPPEELDKIITHGVWIKKGNFLDPYFRTTVLILFRTTARQHIFKGNEEFLTKAKDYNIKC